MRRELLERRFGQFGKNKSALLPPQRKDASTLEIGERVNCPNPYKISADRNQIGGDHASERIWLHTDGSRSLFDELGCFLRERHKGHMARLHFDRLGLGAL